MSPPSCPSQHCHPAAVPSGSVPCPCLPSTPPPPQRVCQGIRFCAILNNSIFIGPTKKQRPLRAHALPGCGPLTPATGRVALSAFPVPLPQHPCVSPPPHPQKKSPARAPVTPSLLGPGERGSVRGSQRWPPVGDTSGTPGWGAGSVPRGQTKGKAWPCPALACSPPNCFGGGKGGVVELYFCTLFRLCPISRARLALVPPGNAD